MTHDQALAFSSIVIFGLCLVVMILIGTKQ